MKNAEIKETVRKSKKWKEFRKELKQNQKYDPVTGSRLVKRSVAHHLDLDVNNYDILSDDRQIMLNPQTHDIVHALYGSERVRYNWKERVDRLIKLFERMDEFNGEYNEGKRDSKKDDY